MVPSHVPPELAAVLLGETMRALPAAELAGVIEDRPDGLGFRHELARRAIESSLPVTRVRLLNQAVVAALRAQDRPERARLMHHAVAAGDVDTVLAVGPQAAREAARAGAHRQALAHLEAVVPYAARLAPAEQAAVLDDYGWELYNAARFREAVRAGSAAGGALRRPRRPGRPGAVPGARVAPLVHGRGDRVRRGLRRARGADPRGRRRRRGAGPGHALSGRDPRPGRGSRAGRGRAAPGRRSSRGPRSAWTSRCCA